MPSPLLFPSIFLVLRAALGYFEILQKQRRVSERAYKAWVKTFDESGCLKKKRRRENGRGFEIGMRGKVNLAAGIVFWVLAVLGDGLGYLRWIGLGILVEMGVTWSLRLLWEKTRVKGWIKGSLKRRRWW